MGGVWIAGRNVYYRCIVKTSSAGNNNNNLGQQQNQPPRPQSHIPVDDPFHNDQVTIGMGMNQVEVGGSNQFSRKERLTRKNASDVNEGGSSPRLDTSPYL